MLPLSTCTVLDSPTVVEMPGRLEARLPVGPEELSAAAMTLEMPKLGLSGAFSACLSDSLSLSLPSESEGSFTDSSWNTGFAAGLSCPVAELAADAWLTEAEMGTGGGE